MTKMAVGIAVKHFRLEILFVSKTTEIYNTHSHKLTRNIPVHLVVAIVIVTQEWLLTLHVLERKILLCFQSYGNLKVILSLIKLPGNTPC